MQLTLMDEVKLLQIALKFVCLTNVFINSGMCVYKLAAVRERVTVHVETIPLNTCTSRVNMKAPPQKQNQFPTITKKILSMFVYVYV